MKRGYKNLHQKKSKKASLVEKGHLNHSADIRYSIIEFKISLNRTCVEKECRNQGSRGHCYFNIIATVRYWVEHILKTMSKFMFMKIAGVQKKSCQKFDSIYVMDIKNIIKNIKIYLLQNKYIKIEYRNIILSENRIKFRFF